MGGSLHGFLISDHGKEDSLFLVKLDTVSSFFI